LGLVVPAFHELLGGILVLSLSAATIAVFLLKRPSLRIWTAVSAAAWIGFLIVFLAPGNTARKATWPDRENYRITLTLSAQALRVYLLPWCLDFKHWLLVFLLWTQSRATSLRQQLPRLDSARAVWIYSLIWLSLVASGFVTIAWITGQPSPPMTVDLLYGVFLIGWLGMVLLLMGPLADLSTRLPHRREISSVALILLSILIVRSANSSGALDDLFQGRAQSWNSQLTQRFNLLKVESHLSRLE
jgi:hypothetical protein